MQWRGMGQEPSGGWLQRPQRRCQDPLQGTQSRQERFGEPLQARPISRHVAGRNKIEYYLLNSQLWGELWPVVPQKGLQPVTLSLYSFPTCLLFPIIAFHIPDVLVFYSMPDFELKV